MDSAGEQPDAPVHDTKHIFTSHFRTASSTVRRTTNRHPLLQLVVTYLMGPFSVIATPQGRASGLWMTIGLMCGVAWVLMPLGWENLLFRIEDPEFAMIIWLAVTAIVILGGFTAWSWAVLQSGRVARAARKEIPGWLLTPRAAGVIGMVVPGLGLQLAGYRRLAAAAFSLAGPLTLCVILLGRAGWLWTWNVGAGEHGLRGSVLESVFIGALVVGTACALGWIVQALDGMRRTPVEVDESPRMLGNWAAPALLVTILLALFTFRPAKVAQELDHQAISLELDGYRAIPFLMMRTAAHLDSSRPEYILHAMEVCRKTGQDSRVASLRADLDRRFSSYVSGLRREDWHDSGAVVRPAPGGMIGPVLPDNLTNPSVPQGSKAP